jgi:hypothetical protein
MEAKTSTRRAQRKGEDRGGPCFGVADPLDSTQMPLSMRRPPSSLESGSWLFDSTNGP